MNVVTRRDSLLSTLKSLQYTRMLDETAKLVLPTTLIDIAHKKEHRTSNEMSAVWNRKNFRFLARKWFVKLSCRLYEIMIKWKLSFHLCCNFHRHYTMISGQNYALEKRWWTAGAWQIIYIWSLIKKVVGWFDIIWQVR